jgi:putative Holliday junction resolvase
MGRLLAIDFGKVRSGIAVTDILQIVANPLDTVLTKDLLTYLMSYCNNEQVDKIIVGEPRQMSGEQSDSMRYITPFVGRLKHALPQMPIVMYDERFTSVLAHRAMIDGGMKKKDRQNKANVDKIAACIILEDYMATIK